MRVELFDEPNSGWVGFDAVRVQGYDIQNSYFLGGQRVALRYCLGTTCEAPTYLHGDHGFADEAWAARAW